MKEKRRVQRTVIWVQGEAENWMMPRPDSLFVQEVIFYAGKGKKKGEGGSSISTDK